MLKSLVQYILIVFVYSFLNALLIECYENDFFRPKFIEFDPDSNAEESIDFDQEKMFQLHSSTNVIWTTNAIELNDLNEQRKIYRLLEKDFFLNIAEIFLYIIFFLVILIFNYENTYIDLKVFSNEYLDTLIKTNTSWDKVTFSLYLYIFYF